MPEDPTELLTVPTRSSASQEKGELCPPTEFSSILSAWQRDSGPNPLILETTGVSSHQHTAELFDKRWVLAQSVIAKLNGVGSGHLAGKMRTCHTEQSWAQCTGCRKVRTFWNHCDLFFCPICQPRLAKERSRAIEWWSQQISQPKHLVLTARNTEDITRQRVQKFKACITKLRRQKHAKGWQAGTWAIEVTNEGKGWHLHAHLLINCAYIDMTAVCTAWAKLVGQDYAVVWVRDVRGTDYVREVAKYAVKGNELARWTGDQIVAFIYAFRGQKLFGVFGKLHGLRTQLRDFLDTMKEARSKCECGCDQYKVYSATQWAWKQETDCPIFSAKPIPPPITQPVMLF